MRLHGPKVQDPKPETQDNHVLSISGGKDSTAMAILMKECGEPIHSMIFFDTGWEFPEIYAHIDKLEQYMGQRIWRLHSTLPFDYWLYERPIAKRKGPEKGIVYRIGNSWPSPSRRWCTSKKCDAISSYCHYIPNVVQCVGYALDERDRPLSNTKYKFRFPLVEYGVTEKQALEICKDRGFDFGGVYDVFDRVSCFCCPLQSLGSLRKLRTHYPDLWRRALDMDRRIPSNSGFNHNKTLAQIDERFRSEDLSQ